MSVSDQQSLDFSFTLVLSQDSEKLICANTSRVSDDLVCIQLYLDTNLIFVTFGAPLHDLTL